MHTPNFWYRPAGPLAWALRPLGAFYSGCSKRRMARARDVYVPPVPVICIGNLNAGGTGKTPCSIAIAQRLGAQGYTPAIVTRGYRGRLSGPIKVDPAQHDSEDVGDEPLLLAMFCPTIVSKDRKAGVKAAITQGADVVLMDDGFQNPHIHKALSIITVDAHYGFGNGLCIPAGPLREPVQTGLKRADLLLCIGKDAAQTRFAAQNGNLINLQKMIGRIEPVHTGINWHNLRVLAFAGIGHPDKFFHTLRALGAQIVIKQAFGDHQRYTSAMLRRLKYDANQNGLQLVTTEKDAVRLPAWFRQQIITLPVRLHIKDWHAFDEKMAQLKR